MMWDINSIMECKKKAVLRIGQYRFRSLKIKVVINLLLGEYLIIMILK